MSKAPRDGYVIAGTGIAAGCILWGGDGTGITRAYAAQVLRSSESILLRKVLGAGVAVVHISTIRHTQ